MTTYSTTARIRTQDDFYFAEWCQELYDCLIACGLVQTADSGQAAIPFVEPRPVTDQTDAGYWVFRFDDTLQSTAPIFLKFYVGMQFATSGNNYPRVWIEIGTGSNGSGTLTGLRSYAADVNSHVISSTVNCLSDVAYPSYFCHTEGFFGMLWKQGTFSGNPINGAFFMSRTVDAAGNPTADGALALWGGGVCRSQAYRYSGLPEAFLKQTAQQNSAPCFAPQLPSQSSVGGDFQAFLAFTILPRVSPIIGVCGVYAAEAPPGTTFNATLVGTAPHTYIPGTIQSLCAVPAGNTVTTAMLWE